MSDSPCRGALAALVLLFAGPAAPAADPHVSPVQPYYDFLVAASQGDVERALATFDAQARVVAGPHCTPAAPCVGHAAIRARYLAPMLAGDGVLPLRDARYERGRLSTRGETGPAQRRGGHVFEFAGGRIRSLAFEPEPEPEPEPPAPRVAQEATVSLP